MALEEQPQFDFLMNKVQPYQYLVLSIKIFPLSGAI